MVSATETAARWDEVRTAFASSILVDTAMRSLAENLDGPAWPGADRQDTPGDYIDYDHDEVVARLAAQGYPAGTLELLMDVLRETMAFDDPFGDMVAHSDAAAAGGNPVLENLEKLGIPETFPINLSSLSQEAKEFCALEGLTTLGAFAVFAQGMSQRVVMGGDFRVLLNALSHIDEAAIARCLPYRPRHRGLHLVEGLAGMVRDLPGAARQQIENGEEVTPAIAMRVDQLFDYFEADWAGIRARVAKGASWSREVMVLEDPAVELAVVAVMRRRLSPTNAPGKASWFRRWLNRLNRHG